MRDPRTAKSLSTTPEDQESRPCWANLKASARTAGRVRSRLRARGGTTLYTAQNRSQPLSMRQKEAQFHDQVVPGGPSVLLGQQTPGPISARMDPGLA